MGLGILIFFGMPDKRSWALRHRGRWHRVLIGGEATFAFFRHVTIARRISVVGVGLVSSITKSGSYPVLPRASELRSQRHCTVPCDEKSWLTWFAIRVRVRVYRG